MFPWKSVIKLTPTCSVPLYHQIADSIVGEIMESRVQPGARLPGSRSMSELLEVHRKTVVAAYEDLEAQGWIEIHPSKGTFVNTRLPVKKPHQITEINIKKGFPEKTGYEVEDYDNIHDPTYPPPHVVGLHDGPDLRMVPTQLISQTYKSILTRRAHIPHLRYFEVEGNPYLRTQLSLHLNESRGLQTSPENIFINRGSQMAIFMASMALLKPGDIVIGGDPGYYYAERVFTHFGAKIIRVPVDKHGLRTDIVREICEKQCVRMLYITPHHHFPTTVTLCAERRMELLELANKCNFAILEDDYDYDFHYESSPLLPLASADTNGMVVYIGSLSKTFAPFLRIGFMVAPQNLLHQIGKRRQIIDIQGDYAMEQTIGELFRLGEIKRHMKKALKIYRQRRDWFCELMCDQLGDRVQFKKPDGGMSIWAEFDPAFPLPEIREAAKKKGLAISNGKIYNKSSDRTWNAARLGFSSLNLDEIEFAVGVLKEVMR
ncbi:MAG: aminotransferase class I/II-fold pyridoxal phosphate-dependent enzyme [Bacteroidetes bacterium]|nr:aminotransferase class I/II-fold pyridoxal phosphate-dependent enzyme [Bacteroidota bacterium]